MVEHSVNMDQDLQASNPTDSQPFLEARGIGRGRGGQAGEQIVISHFLFPLYLEPQPEAVELRNKREVVVRLWARRVEEE